MKKSKSGGWLYFFPIFSSVLLAAHFSRVDLKGISLLCLIFPMVLLIKKIWVLRFFQIYLIGGGVVWIQRTLALRSLRIEMGEPWLRLALILGAVAFFTLLSAFIMEKKRFKERYVS